MSKMNLTDCIALAEFAHRNQLDKAGLPYIAHPHRVMQMVQEQGAEPYVQMAAVLHDVTEDTPFTSQMLLDLGVPSAAVDIVWLLDRGASKKYYDETCHTFDRVGRYTADEFYYEHIKSNPGALQVKLADIADNTLPWRLSYLPEKTRKRLNKKYARAKQQLGC